MSSARGGVVGATRSPGAVRRGAGRVFGLAGVLALLVGSLATLSVSAPAGASNTTVIAETFQHGNVTSPSSWVKPTGPGGAANSACLTAGTATSQTPIPDCSASGGDPDGSGVLQLTDTGGQEEGGALTSVSVPASNGLDASFDSYQWGGGGADGIGFVIAAEDPSDPVAPTQIGNPGGDLGYSAGTGGGFYSNDQGLANGYLGVGLDVYGNYSNPNDDGTGCTDPTWATGAAAGQVVVRGPGNGTAGYCLLDSSAHELGGTQGLEGPSRAGSLVPVEVVLNTTSGPVHMSGSRFGSDSVPTGDYGVAWVPIGGSPEFYTGPLPTTNNGGIPSGLYPSSWVNPATGIPYQLGFGWVGSTGAVTDYHQISNASVTSLQQVPVLSAAMTDSDNGQLPSGGTVAYTLQAGVSASGGNENHTITMTATLPGGVTPGTAAATGGWACATAGQVVTCTYAGPFPVTAGTTLPPVSLPATIADVGANTPLDGSVTVSSDDGDPAMATDDATSTSPASLSSVTLSATETSNQSSATAPAGIGTIGLDNNGNLPTVTQQTSTTGTSSTGLSGSPNAAVASTKIGAIKIGSIKIGAIKMGAIKIGAIKIGAIALGSQSQDITSLSNALLSNIGVTYPDGCAGSACTDWNGILAGSKYAGFPLQSVSLEDVLTTTGSDSPDNSNPAARLNSLPLSDIDIDGSSLGALPVAAYALGGTPIDNIPLNAGDFNSDGTVNQDQTLTDWCTALNSVHWPCSDFGITSDSRHGRRGQRDRAVPRDRRCPPRLHPARHHPPRLLDSRWDCDRRAFAGRDQPQRHRPGRHQDRRHQDRRHQDGRHPHRRGEDGRHHDGQHRRSRIST